jgi:putative FmdB family regulatory protein
MPQYTFQCNACGLRFDKRLPVAKRNDPRKCPSCDNPETVLQLPDSVAGHFKKNVTGPVPQNTGIHDLDTHIDRVIGQSAHQGWEVQHDRLQQKQDVMRRHGVDGDDLSKNPDGSYRVLKPEEKAAHNRSQKIHEAHGQWKKRRRRRR